MYKAPLGMIRHSLASSAKMNNVSAFGHGGDFDADLVAPILEEAGKLARDVLSPINRSGHDHGATLSDDGVLAAPGFKEAYRVFQEGGWMGLGFPAAYGGQPVPRALALAVIEMIHASNMSFGLCPLLTFSAIDALLEHGNEYQKATYLPKLISGEWTGAMDLTEPQAGSDIGALRTRATPNPDGSYAIIGQKIFITWGDHNLTENIIHLVLGRLPDAPDGSKGVSLFLVPKILLTDAGALGPRNAVRCIGLEHKIGIHASPTCVMEFDGATGYLVGTPNRGLSAMFTMMNAARLNVGLQGVAVGEAACQIATAYALERRQGRARGSTTPSAIIDHPDIRRSLVHMRATTQAARSICYACGAAADRARRSADSETRAVETIRESILTPIAKAWSTDRGVEAANLCMQVYGGMGYMEETAAAQLYLDARIAPIYEGTNGIQAIDLVRRKLAADNGAGMYMLLAEIREHVENTKRNGGAIAGGTTHLAKAVDALEDASSWMISVFASDRDTALANATTYLQLAGDVFGGYYLLLDAAAPNTEGESTGRTMAALADYYSRVILTRAPGLRTSMSIDRQLLELAS